MYLIKDKKKNYNYDEIWEKVCNIIKKECNSELVYNKKYLNAKKNQHKRKISICLCTSKIEWFSL